MPFLQDGPPADWPDAWYSQTKGNEVYYTQRIIQTDRWKYVCNWFDFDELYDLEADPHEMMNLAFPSGIPSSPGKLPPFAGIRQPGISTGVSGQVFLYRNGYVLQVQTREKTY